MHRFLGLLRLLAQPYAPFCFLAVLATVTCRLHGRYRVPGLWKVETTGLSALPFRLVLVVLSWLSDPGRRCYVSRARTHADVMCRTHGTLRAPHTRAVCSSPTLLHLVSILYRPCPTLPCSRTHKENVSFDVKNPGVEKERSEEKREARRRAKMNVDATG